MGGIVPKREVRVSMNRERLFISTGKITVEYEFENRTSKDVTTQIAFPIPEYSYPGESPRRDFPDFKLWINGEPAAYGTDARAFVDGIDKTSILREMGITVETFGGFDHLKSADSKENGGRSYFLDYEVNELSEEQKSVLIEQGFVDGCDDSWRQIYLSPRWSVRKAYYWTQRFPARQKVVIRHEYAPVVGFQRFKADEIQKELKDTCITKELVDKLRVIHRSHKDYKGDYPLCVEWVRYILTTANSWKRPIKEFELIVESTPSTWGGPESKIISLCWNGRAIVSENGHISVREKNFIPKKDLVVYFYEE